MGVEEEDVSPFDLTIGERAALAEIREIRHAVGYEDHPVDDPARATVYIAALEAKIVEHYEVHVAIAEIREQRRREEDEGGPLYLVGCLVAILIVGVTSSALVYLLVLIWQAIL